MKWLTIIYLSFVCMQVHAQDSSDSPKRKWEVNGYIKDLETINFSKGFRDIVSNNLIHNRLNWKWTPVNNLKLVAEFRNRLFWGEEVKQTPNFASFLRNDNEKFNLQKVWINTPSLVLHSNTERLYADYQGSEWNVRLGRQRINWGMTTTWNPNDIFNTYNFIDFDYEERPGVDAAKFQYQFSPSFHTELAYANTGKKDGSVAALRYFLNRWGYDMQLITGWYNEHLTVGAGWAGSIKDAGFKGEVQYFLPSKDSIGHFNVSLETDYMFKKNWYLNVGFLFSGDGISKPVNDWNAIQLNFSPEYPMPTKWNMMVTGSKEFTPLFRANLSMLYSPGINLLLLFPTLQYNMATNLDVDFIWQSFFAEIHSNFQDVNHRVYLRFKWSF